MSEHLTIDCDTCVMQHTSTCGDCLVTYICSREPHGAVIIESAELQALRLLTDAGLVPALRHRPRFPLAADTGGIMRAVERRELW